MSSIEKNKDAEYENFFNDPSELGVMEEDDSDAREGTSQDDPSQAQDDQAGEDESEDLDETDEDEPSSEDDFGDEEDDEDEEGDDADFDEDFDELDDESDSFLDECDHFEEDQGASKPEECQLGGRGFNLESEACQMCTIRGLMGCDSKVEGAQENVPDTFDE